MLKNCGVSVLVNPFLYHCQLRHCLALPLPETIKRWSLRRVQTKLIKIGGRLVRHARRLVFQLAEVMVTRDMFNEMLERIGRLRLVPS